VSLDLDTEVASTVEASAADAKVSRGESVDHAIRAMDRRELVARIGERNDLYDDAAIGLANDERAPRGPSARRHPRRRGRPLF
jgi:hypothetical protein